MCKAHGTNTTTLMGSWHELEATNKPTWLGCPMPVWWINPRAKAEGRRRLYVTQLTGPTTLTCNTRCAVFFFFSASDLGLVFS